MSESTEPMEQSPSWARGGVKHPGFLRLLNAFSLVTMAMTVPQAVPVWRGNTTGVSLLSWAAYLVSACLRMVHGVREGHDCRQANCGYASIRR